MALIGVALSLILQNRQLRASQVQLIRQMHLELTKMGIENPQLPAAIWPHPGRANFLNSGYINFLLTLWQTSYLQKTMTKKALELEANYLFASDYSRTWWGTLARGHREAQAETKREKEFFAIIDNAYKSAMQAWQANDHPEANPPSEESTGV